MNQTINLSHDNAETANAEITVLETRQRIKHELSQQFSQPHISPWLTITQERINAFADATMDHQWIHVDTQRAQTDTGFGDTIAHGYLTLSLYPYLRGLVSPNNAPFPGINRVINYGINRLRFPTPVICGQEIRGISECLSLESIGEAYQLCEKFTVEISGQQKPALSAEILMRLYP